MRRVVRRRVEQDRLHLRRPDFDGPLPVATTTAAPSATPRIANAIQARRRRVRRRSQLCASASSRRADGWHRFLTLELAPGFLRTYFGPDELAKLTPAVRRFVQTPAEAALYLEIRALPASLLAARV